MNTSFYLKRCNQLIEEKLQWGPSTEWTGENFKYLSEEIKRSSGVLLSTKTLQRLFRQIRVEQYNPQLETKNALAKYLDYKDWEDFRKKNPPAGSIVSAAEPPDNITENTFSNDKEQPKKTRIEFAEPVPQETKKKNPVFSQLGKRAVSVSIVICLLAGSSFFFLNAQRFSNKQRTSPVQVAFTGKNVKGYPPLSVIFNYNISKVPEDTVHLDFDENGVKRMPLPKDKYMLARTYFLPNFYKTSIQVNNKPVSTVDVHALSKGWEAYIFTLQEACLGSLALDKYPGLMQVSRQEVLESTKLPRKQEYFTEYRNIQDFKASGDHFVFETRSKNSDEWNEDRGMRCNGFSIFIKGAHRTIRISFVQGCASWAKLVVGEVFLDGQFNDLSMFSQDISQWRTTRLEIKNKKATIFFENKPIYQLSYQQFIGKIKGIVYKFKGSGSVDYVKLYDSTSRLVYEDNF